MNEIGNEDKPPQKTFTHYAIQMALDQINALSDSLIAIQASEYQVEKNTITSLAFIIREKTQDIKNFMEDMAEAKRAIVLGEPISLGGEEGLASRTRPETEKNALFDAMIRWYEKERKKQNK